MKTNKEEFEDLVEKCYLELSLAYKETYSPEKAEKTAAMFLAAQMQLAFFITSIERDAKFSKAEIERIGAEKYFEVKDNSISEKKITEATLQNMVAKNEEVIKAKKLNCEIEAELKKYGYIMSSLKDGHHYFKMIAKANSEWNG